MNYENLNTTLGVDRAAGVIRGVSVITTGRAIGHNLTVDSTTLSQIAVLGNEARKVPVKINHGSGVDAVCGHLVNFRREDNKVLADWKLLKSHPQFSQILETAEEQPETVGLSVSYTDKPSGGRDNEGNGYARVGELLSVDYVSKPAANPNGLFHAKVNGRVIDFSRGHNFGSGLGILAAALIAQRARDASRKAVQGALRSPFTKAAASGFAGAAGAAAASGLIAARKRRKREREEEEARSQHHNKFARKGAKLRLVSHKNGPVARTAIRGGGAHDLPKLPTHLSVITDSIIELNRVSGPARRPERARAEVSPGNQARNAAGQFEPGPASSPDKMRQAYGKRSIRPGLAFRLKAIRMAAQRNRENSNV